MSKPKPPNPSVPLDGAKTAKETGRLISTPAHTGEVTMELAKESEINAVFDTALKDGKIDAIDKLIVLFQVENPLATDKECAQFLRMSVAVVKRRQLNPALLRIKQMIEGTFSDLATRARYIGLKRMTHIMETGGSKVAVEAYRALEQAAAASEAARAAMNAAGITPGTLPTTEQAKKILEADPAQDDSEVEIEPLD